LGNGKHGLGVGAGDGHGIKTQSVVAISRAGASFLGPDVHEESIGVPGSVGEEQSPVCDILTLPSNAVQRSWAVRRGIGGGSPGRE
jgi:hypothetical protein